MRSTTGRDNMNKSEEKGVYHEYFTWTKQYTEQLGENTILLCQVGAFFESYGLKDVEGNGSRINDFCRIGELKLAEKSKDKYRGHSILMAGFGEYNLEKYLRLLTNAGYNVVVFVQTDDMTKANAKKRVFSAIYSPGTFLSLDESSSQTLSNNTMVVWVSTYTSTLRQGGEARYLCGFSVVNIMSGHSSLYEYTTTKIISPTSFDDLERAMASFTPSEILFIHTDPHSEEADQILQFTGMNQCKTIHRIAESQEKIQRLSKQAYIDTTLTFYLGDKVATICQEFTMYEFATRCFVYLLDFLQSHNPHLVQKIAIPVFSNSSSRVILANHTLKQLQMLGPKGVIASLNGTRTAMGSRLFQYQMQNPTFDTTWLQEQYDAIAWVLQLGEGKMAAMQQHLSKIRDLERIRRRLLFGKIYPGAVYELYRGISEWSAIIEQVGLPPNMTEWSQNADKRTEFLKYLETHLDLSVCEGMNDFDFVETTKPLFRNLEKNQMITAHSSLQNAHEQLDRLQQRLQSFTQELNRVIQQNKASKSIKLAIQGTLDDWIKVHETAKSGSSLQLTQVRAMQLKEIIQKHGSQISIQVLDCGDIPLNQFRVVSATGSASAMSLECPQLQTTCKEIMKMREKVAQLSAECYQVFLGTLEQVWGSFIAQQAEGIAHFDCLLNKAYKALKYRYCLPEIVSNTEEEEDHSFFDAQDLRHVLIEQMPMNEMYVANDLALGASGLLLFGTNAVGKTSLIKAAGIATLMAQAGMYVPCSRFRYRPYKAVYSRILGNDDIFRGLSTFVVEMSELRVILKSADKYSLVLGDELCSGTETESALSIFVAGLQHLSLQKATFIFATHFHEIVHYEEVVALTKQSDGKRSDGKRSDCKRSDCKQSDCKRSDCKQSDGKQSDGKQSDCKQSDCKQSDCKQSDCKGALQMKHLSVLYDREKETLVYDRKLKEGSGEAIYGLEVAKSLFMPTDFLEAAFQLRAKYFPSMVSPLSCKPSKYNARKIRSMCEICKQNRGEEVHHKVPQQLADAQGFLPGGFVKKNHKANLLSVCEACHGKIHAIR